MMGCCSIVGLFWGMSFMVSPLIVGALVFYLLTVRPETARTKREF